MWVSLAVLRSAENVVGRFRLGSLSCTARGRKRDRPRPIEAGQSRCLGQTLAFEESEREKQHRAAPKRKIPMVICPPRPRESGWPRWRSRPGQWKEWPPEHLTSISPRPHRGPQGLSNARRLELTALTATATARAGPRSAGRPIASAPRAGSCRSSATDRRPPRRYSPGRCAGARP